MLSVAEQIPAEDKKAVVLSDVVDSGWITMADRVRNFQRAFADKRVVEHGARPARPAPAPDGAYRLAPLGQIVAHGGMNAHQDALCACGSGLRSCRCCELDTTFAASPEARERVDILAKCAAKALASGATLGGANANSTSNSDTHSAQDADFAHAAEAIHQAVQDNPDIANLSHQVITENTPQGLRIQLVDQEGQQVRLVVHDQD